MTSPVWIIASNETGEEFAKSSRKGSGLLPKKLTEKEKLFCSYYAQGGDARGCAARAGFILTPQRSAAKLLARGEIKAEILKAEKDRKNSYDAARGLHRLAFGSVTDALRLMLCDGEMTAEEIEKLDFFKSALDVFQSFKGSFYYIIIY